MGSPSGPDTYTREAASGAAGGEANIASAMKSVVADPVRYDWEGDAPLRRPFAETIIYELHVRRLHPASQLRSRGRQARARTPA